MSHVHESPNAEELPELLERLEAQIGRVFGRFHLAPVDAEDLLQETLLQFILRRREIVTPEAWLIGTLKKQCLMFWRRRRRSLLEAIDADLLEELAGSDGARQEKEDLSRDLSRVVSRLPERCRSLLRLRYGLGCEGPEVAARMGYSPTGIRTITNRCLTALTQQMLAVGLEGYAT